MSELIKDELNTVNGGMDVGVIEEILGGPEFVVGDRVKAKYHPEFGVGTVTERAYTKGWYYDVVFPHGEYCMC